MDLSIWGSGTDPGLTAGLLNEKTFLMQTSGDFKSGLTAVDGTEMQFQPASLTIVIMHRKTGQVLAFFPLKK